ncbi:MAG: DUF952 domain-containing protein [Caulobacteraceae bacterium]|nr:DUF952 domain-containing protein [Caulobacteraceae bacterium]
MSADARQDGPAEAFKVVDAAEWAEAEAAGSYAGSAVDLADGYIHLSAEDQLAGTVSKHYAGRQNLLLLTVDLEVLGETIVWEPSRGGALFPHIYGSLPVAAVTAKKAFSVGADGEMVFA